MEARSGGRYERACRDRRSGKSGRAILRQVLDGPVLELSAVNDSPGDRAEIPFGRKPVYQSILIATDLLRTSLPALRAGLQLAREQRARVGVVYVLEVWMVERQWFTPVSNEDIAFHREFLEREERAVLGELRAQIDRERGEQGLAMEVDPLVRDGRAADEIVAVRDERVCDLIVIGTRGRRTRLGSIAEEVVRIAGCPVLVVPAEREP